jgi:hypothetical protein
MRTTQLRLRFLASLAASGALVGASLSACGGAVETTGNGSSGASGASSGNTSGGTSGNYTPTTPAPTPPSKPVPACEYGMSTTTCMTHEQLESMLLNPPRGGDAEDAGADADVSIYFDENGCLPSTMVRNDCCNLATSGPVLSGDRCCYTFCQSGCCGRPFLVEGEARLASVIERGDWMLVAGPMSAGVPASGTWPSAPQTGRPLDAETRGLIASAWARDAAMEHASVASFARFTLELLAVGAPSDIVMGAQDAGRDEIEHARACFAIASRYAGRDLGPGPLDVRGASPAVTLAAAVRAAVVEGCIGETLSALLAEARLARAEDADVRAALRRIANEEAHHAELAWRFVGWAVATGGDELRAIAKEAFVTALAQAPNAWDPALRDVAPETLRAHGLLDAFAAREVAERVLGDVVGPCAAALVGELAAAA